MLKAGLTGYSEEFVTKENTAIQMCSGTVEVYATPCMIALMEKASVAATAPHLDEGGATVGTELSVRHLAATPLGMKVWAESELLSVEGRKLSFRVQAFDEKGPIGEGTHERFVIDVEKFLKKAEEKKK